MPSRRPDDDTGGGEEAQRKGVSWSCAKPFTPGSSFHSCEAQGGRFQGLHAQMRELRYRWVKRLA